MPGTSLACKHTPLGGILTKCQYTKCDDTFLKEKGYTGTACIVVMRIGRKAERRKEKRRMYSDDGYVSSTSF
jgi:hypothetical protein